MEIELDDVQRFCFGSFMIHKMMKKGISLLTALITSLIVVSHAQKINSKSSHSRSYSCSDLFSTRQLSLYSLVMILSALTIEISVAIIIFDVQVKHFAVVLDQ